MFSPSLLSTLLLVLAIGAQANPIVQVRDSPITLPVSRRVNLDADGTLNLYQHDYKRAQALIARGKAGTEDKRTNTPVDNTAVSYIASVGVGSPATQCE